MASDKKCNVVCTIVKEEKQLEIEIDATCLAECKEDHEQQVYGFWDPSEDEKYGIIPSMNSKCFVSCLIVFRIYC